jgi:hypothetical protein
MQKPNYQFEKRRRDMDKMAKKRQKEQRKRELASRPALQVNPDGTPVTPPEGTVADAAEATDAEGEPETGTDAAPTA